MYMRMPKIIATLALALFIAAGANAQKEPKWQSQLRHLIECPDSILAANGLRLTGWTEGDTLADDRSVIEYERRLLDGKNYLPRYKDLKIELMRMEDIRKEFAENQLEHLYPEAIRLTLLGVLSIYMQAVELEWEYRGQRITTPAVVDRAQGVVYDHILSNIFVPKIEVKREVSKLKSSPDKGEETLQLTETITGTVHNLVGESLSTATLTHEAYLARKDSVVQSFCGTNVGRQGANGYPIVTSDIQYKWVEHGSKEGEASKVVYLWYFIAGGAIGDISWNGEEPEFEGGASTFGRAYFMKGTSLITANDPEWQIQ